MVELIDHPLDDVVLDPHAIGRDVVASDPIEVSPPHGMDGKTEPACDLLYDGFDRKHGLRPAIASEGSVRHGVGLACKPANTDVGQKVAVVDVAQRAREHGRRVVSHVTAVGRQREVEGENMSLRVETDVIADEERVALAGGAHVVIAWQPQLHRLPRLPSKQRRDPGNDRRLALFAAERAAHPPHLDRDGVERQPEKVRNAMLDFGRMLGRAPHMHVGALARRSERDLPLEIEMVLTAAVQLAGKPMRRAGDRCLHVAADHELRRRNVAVPRHRLFNRQHRGKRFVVDGGELRRGARLIECGRRDRRHRLAFVFDDVRGQCRLATADRRDVVLTGNVGRRDRERRAGGGEAAR